MSAGHATGQVPRPPTPAWAGLPPRSWRGVARVRFAHCDPAGMVYFPRWFDILHALVEDWMAEALALDHAGYTRRGLGLGYGHAEADFFKPGRDGDRLRATVLVARVGERSLTLSIPVFRETEPILLGRLVMVPTRLADGTAIGIPDELGAALARYTELCGSGGDTRVL